mmetsp:Transcript_67792/g.107470  ORF Transcript_67792/g.107470 Transcript_67792/m.107470 type:complete len:202 (+) Transcript_67792:696-1301(+)
MCQSLDLLSIMALLLFATFDVFLVQVDLAISSFNISLVCSDNVLEVGGITATLFMYCLVFVFVGRILSFTVPFALLVTNDVHPMIIFGRQVPHSTEVVLTCKSQHLFIKHRAHRLPDRNFVNIFSHLRTEVFPFPTSYQVWSLFVHFLTVTFFMLFVFVFVVLDLETLRNLTPLPCIGVCSCCNRAIPTCTDRYYSPVSRR